MTVAPETISRGGDGYAAASLPPRRLAYIVSGVLGDRTTSKGGDRTSPRAEYEEIIRQTGASLFGLDDARRANPALHRLAPKRSIEYLLLALFLRLSLKSYSHFIFSGEDIGMPAALALWRRSSPAHIVITIHGFYFENKKFRSLARVVSAMKNVRYACLSEAVRDQMIARFGADASRCHSIGYFADTEFFSPLPSATDEVVISSAGLSQRDYRTFVAATRDLPFSVKIAAASQWITQQPTAIDMPSNIEMRSFGTHAKLRQLYADSAIVVVPLWDVRFAAGYAVIAEAMAMGRPVILTRTGAPPDFIEDDKNALMVPAGDPAALRSAILMLLADRPRAERLGAAARTKMLTEFSLETYCQALLAIVEVS